MSKDHTFLPSTEEENTPIEENESVELLKAATEANPPAAVTEADLEWRQFIHQELEKLQNREKVERNGMPKKATSSNQTLASIIKKLPVESMIESAVRFFIKEKPTPTNKSKNRSKRA
jgi:hypothetical protein